MGVSKYVIKTKTIKEFTEKHFNVICHKGKKTVVVIDHNPHSTDTESKDNYFRQKLKDSDFMA